MTHELTAEAKLFLSRSFILSHFNYCPLIWHFCGLGGLKNRKGSTQGSTLCFNDFHASYSDLRSRAGWPLLYLERLKTIVREVFRIYPNVSPEYNRSILIKRSTPHNVRNSKRLEVPTFPTIRHGKYAFRYEAVKL